MALSGAVLREVGTTNRTHLRDYEKAIGPNTGMLLRVHTSNYRIVGFEGEVPLEDLVALGKAHGLPVVDDVGSGALVSLAGQGLPGDEPLIADEHRGGRRPRDGVGRQADRRAADGARASEGPTPSRACGRTRSIARCAATSSRSSRWRRRCGSSSIPNGCGTPIRRSPR